MIRRYCDDCFRRLPTCLEEFEKQPGKFVSELKVDGYRALLEFTEAGIIPWSRKWKKHPIGKEMAQLLKEKLSFPVGTILDGEWMERRTEGPEAVILWDVMVLGGAWQGDLSYAERMKLLVDVPDIWTPETLKGFPQMKGPLLTLTHRQYANFRAHYDLAQTLPWTEGLVVKGLTSRLIGSTKDRVDNPYWTKCKFRGGSAGDALGVQS